MTSTKRVASETVVTVEARPVEINAGASTEASVRLKVDDGYHINANPASFPYLIATQLEVPKVDGLSAAKVTYPQPLIGKFSFSSDARLGVYDHEADLKVAFLADASAKHGQTSHTAKQRLQAWSDQLCFPRRSII